ncbi:hypothetical protein L1887_42181 [Cichorium endivia]|nr:hypothetical protein L1887_42181 [Cichorium endivia]
MSRAIRRFTFSSAPRRSGDREKKAKKKKEKRKIRGRKCGLKKRTTYRDWHVTALWPCPALCCAKNSPRVRSQNWHGASFQQLWQGTLAPTTSRVTIAISLPTPY